jgi:hypothetical protein
VINIDSLLQLGAILEPEFGTLLFISHVLLFAILIGILSSLFALLLKLASSLHANQMSNSFVRFLNRICRHDPGWEVCEVGLSGALFCMDVMCATPSPGTRIVLRVVPVPNWLDPCMNLLAMQTVAANVSLTGHPAGVIVNYSYLCRLWRSWLAWKRTCATHS